LNPRDFPIARKHTVCSSLLPLSKRFKRSVAVDPLRSTHYPPPLESGSSTVLFPRFAWHLYRSTNYYFTVIHEFPGTWYFLRGTQHSEPQALERQYRTGRSWLQDFRTSRSSRRSGTNRLGHGLSLVITRTSHHDNPHDNDADDDIDELSGIVSRLVACNSGFFCISFITHS
jgi:hypothetical protein